MENKILPPTPLEISNVDVLHQSSRKRTFTAMNQQGIACESNSEYGFTRESDLQHSSSSLSGMNVHGSSPELFSVEPATFRHKSEEIQVHVLNNFPETMQNNDGNLHNFGVSHHSFHYRGCSPVLKLSDEVNIKRVAYNICHTGECEALPVSTSYNACAEKGETASGLQDHTSTEHMSHTAMGSQPLEVCGSSSKSLRSSEVLEQSLVNPGMLVDFDEKSDSPKDIKYQTCDLKQSGQDVNAPEISGISTVGTSSLGESSCIVDNQNDTSVQHGVQLGSDSLSIGVEDNCKGRDHSEGDGNIQLMNKMDGSDAENLKQSLAMAASLRHGDSYFKVDIGPGQRNGQCDGSLQSDEKGRSLTGKVGLAVAEKLWDGSLQLNSSVTVSAIAFFKSGEKVPDIKWSESVEVKGKVRLEAFEKYIQDLPRSRNRGLMVISLCWKDGSSETGLAGMKEVAKEYKEGERVGFAQLSQGIDLYICPRSDAIITVLAKHGFFKGKAAIEDNQDSLIGCVVWRRNQALSSSVMKNSKKKNCSSSERPPTSPSDSSTQGAAEKKLPHAEPGSKSTVALATDCPTPENAGKGGIGSQIITSSKTELDVCSVSTISNSLPTPTLPCSSSSLPVGLQPSSCVDSASYQGTMGQSLETEAPLTHYSGQEKPKPSLELEKPGLPLPSDVIRGHRPIYNDDDLPEYDFGAACGISQVTMSNLLDVAIVDKKLSAGGSGRWDGALTPTMQTEQSLPTFSQRRSENLNPPRFPPDAVQKMAPGKTVCDPDQIPGLPLLEEKHIAQSRQTMTHIEATSVPRSKNLFDDDDDMPEWCPPDLELHKQLVPERSIPSTISFPSAVPKPPFECIYPGRPPHPRFPFPFPSANNPPYSTQPHPHIANPMNQSQSEPFERHVLRGPCPPMEAIRPSRNSFDVRFPVNPPGWRSWRP